MLLIVIYKRQIGSIRGLRPELPACSLHAGNVSSHSLHSELISAHFKVAQDTTALTAHDTAVANLCRSGIAVHLRKLQLGLRADSGRESGISYHVSKRLSLRLELLEGFSLGVISNRSDVVEASYVEFLRAKYGHLGGIVMFDRQKDPEQA